MQRRKGEKGAIDKEIEETKREELHKKEQVLHLEKKWKKKNFIKKKKKEICDVVILML